MAMSSSLCSRPGSSALILKKACTGFRTGAAGENSRSPSVTFRDNLRPSAGLRNDRYFSGGARRREDRHPFLASLFAHSRAPIPRAAFRLTAHRENLADEAVRNALPLASPPATP